MQAKHSLEFARAPAIWSMYPGIMMARKPLLVPEGGAVPRIEARLATVVIDRRHLANYAQVCGAAAGATLPIAYPHVLAMPLHLAMLGAEAFPVKLFGLVHLRNRIAMRQPLSAEEPAEIRAWIEGHRETERGQEFDLHTEYVVGGDAIWDETCTFLARRKPPAGTKPNLARHADDAPEGTPLQSSSFPAPSGLGRRYGFISGDVNPIHMSDLTARAFGFPRAIAHGMWSLGRSASDFESAQFDGGCELSVSFKLPIFMPSWLTLQRWSIENGSGFALRDAQGEKPHLAGTLKSLR
jgi:acyl dehydratase